MNMFKKNEAKSVEEYLLMVPVDRKKDIDFLHDFIQKAVPKLKPYFASNMIGYGSFYYLDSKKQKKVWPIISLANQKNYISIYVCTVIEDKSAAEKYKKDLGKTFKVLIEGDSKKSTDDFKGRNSQNKMVIFPKTGKHQPGDYVRVKIEEVSSATLLGNILSE